MIVTGIIVRNTLVMYDREHSKIGFWKTNCSELWERLHITGALSPIPSSSEGKNSSTDLSPSEPPNYVLPGTVCCSSSSNHICFFSTTPSYMDTCCGPHCIGCERSLL